MIKGGLRGTMSLEEIEEGHKLHYFGKQKLKFFLWTGGEAMKNGIPIVSRAGFESVEDPPRTAVGFSSKAFQDLPPELRLSATSNGEQRVRVRVPNVQGLTAPPNFLCRST